MRIATHLTLTLAGSFVVAASAQAGVIDSASFNAVTDGAVDTTGTLDWGYVSEDGSDGTKTFFDSTRGVLGSYDDTDYGLLTSDEGNILTTVKASPSIGTVTLTEGTDGSNTVVGQGNDANFTFDGNTAYGSYGNFGGSEQDVWKLTLNDLGLGTFTVTLYLSHSSDNRIFDVDATLTDSGGVATDTTQSPQIGTLGSTVGAYNGSSSGTSFTYDITVTTASADADLDLVFGGGGGGSGGAIFAGYTVSGSVIPEPASLALLGLGSVLIAGRRKRTA